VADFEDHVTGKLRAEAESAEDAAISRAAAAVRAANVQPPTLGDLDVGAPIEDQR
jgi:hypothetical protein